MFSMDLILTQLFPELDSRKRYCKQHESTMTEDSQKNSHISQLDNDLSVVGVVRLEFGRRKYIYTELSI